MGGGGIWTAIKLCMPQNIYRKSFFIFYFFNSGVGVGGIWMPVIKPCSPRISIGFSKIHFGWGGGGRNGGRRGIWIVIKPCSPNISVGNIPPL